MSFFGKSTKVKVSLLFSQPSYLFEEQSFINYEPNDVSLMINPQYLALDVSLKGNVITGITGYFNRANYPERSLEPIELLAKHFTTEKKRFYELMNQLKSKRILKQQKI